MAAATTASGARVAIVVRLHRDRPGYRDGNERPNLIQKIVESTYPTSPLAIGGAVRK
jgi:hypothetical protein